MKLEKPRIELSSERMHILLYRTNLDRDARDNSQNRSKGHGAKIGGLQTQKGKRQVEVSSSQRKLGSGSVVEGAEALV